MPPTPPAGFGRRRPEVSRRLAKPAGAAGPVEFTGQRGPLFKLLVKNAIFKLLTLWIYRFWAKTWIRRYFWNNIRIDGDPLEYNGLPSELFIGFLIVLGILVPLGMAYEGVRLVLESGSEAAQSAVGIAYTLVMFILIQVAFYRMWRYRLTRTTWRGIRFGLDGSTWRFLGLSVGWTLLSVVTLGLAYPWMRVALMRYRIQHTRFGQTRFDFAGSGKALFGPFLLAFGLPVALTVAFVAANPDLGGGVVDSLAAGAEPEFTNVEVRAPALLLVWLAVPFLYIWYRVWEFRYMVGCTGFADVSFASAARSAWIIWMSVLTVGAIVLPGFVFGVVFALAADGTGFWFIVPLVVVLYIIVAPILSYLILRYEIVAHVCRTLEISDMAAFDRVVQSTQEVPATGEGLADAFDVGAI
ncbi:MAG: DUF898 domain-containing protein [Proteobacteria bacterium]|nr:DUF898 domain-containing protein [Pseudomonadota bacterium]